MSLRPRKTKKNEPSRTALGASSHRHDTVECPHCGFQWFSKMRQNYTCLSCKENFKREYELTDAQRKQNEMNKRHGLSSRWNFIKHKKSGLEGDYLGGSEMRWTGRKGKRKRVRMFRFAMDTGKTLALTKEQLEKNWLPLEEFYDWVKEQETK